MIKESPIGDNQTHLIGGGSNQIIQIPANAHEEVQDNDTPIIQPFQGRQQDQLPLQMKAKLQSQSPPPTQLIIRNSLKDIGPQSQRRERKSTFSRFQEQIQSAVAVITNRGDEEESDDSNRRVRNNESNNQNQEKCSISLRCWEYIKNALIFLENFLSNKDQKYQSTQMEEKYIQVRLESSFEGFICTQLCLAFAFIILFIINISRGKFSDSTSSSSHSSSTSSSSSNNSNNNNSTSEYSFDYPLSEVIVQLILGIFNLALILVSKSKRLFVRALLVMYQLGQLVYLDKLLFGDINDYFYDSLTNPSSSSSNSTQSSSDTNYTNAQADSWDIYVELRYELIKTVLIQVGCVLLTKNMIGWNYRFFLSSLLTCVFGIILYHKNSFWLFLSSLILLTILFSYYFYHEEKKSRSTFAELQSHQDKNSPSLYNMIHEQISSGLIVVTRNIDGNIQASSAAAPGTELLQLKFANKISVGQLQCRDENDILQKFKEIQVRPEMNQSFGEDESEDDSSSSSEDIENNKQSNNLQKKEKESNLNKKKKQNQASNMGQNYSLYDKLVNYMEEIYQIEQQRLQQQQQQLLIQQQQENQGVSMNSLQHRRYLTCHPNNIINRIKTDQSKKTSSMIQLGKSEPRKNIRQSSFTPVHNKSKSQTPRHSTMVRANQSSNLIPATNLNVRPISSDYSIQKKNSIFNQIPSDLHQKSNQASGSKIENNSELKFRRKGSFINMNAVVSQYTPRNAAINSVSPVRGNIGKSTPSGEDGFIDSQNKGSQNKLKTIFSQVSDGKGYLSSPQTNKNCSPDRKRTLEKKAERSSFGQLLYGVMKSSTHENQQPLRFSAYDTHNSIQKESDLNRNQSIFNFSTNNNNKSSKPKKESEEQQMIEDESCNIKEDQIQFGQNKAHLGSNNQVIGNKYKQENNKSSNENAIKNGESGQQEGDEDSSEESSNQQNSLKERNQFASSMIQVQIPTSEINFQQFDFKINLIEWDNSPALIILVTDSTEKLINEKLKELEMYKEELLYTMQHISRTPLNSIINISDILLNQYFKQYIMSSSQRQILPINTPSILQSNNAATNFNTPVSNNTNNIYNNNPTFNINANNANPIQATSLLNNNNSNNNNSNNNNNSLSNNNNNNVTNTNINNNNNNTNNAATPNTNSPNYVKQASTNSIPNVYGNSNNNAANTPSVLNNFPSLNQHYSSQSHYLGNDQFANAINGITISPSKMNPQNANNLASIAEKQITELESVVQNLHIIKNNGLILLHTINTVTDLSLFQTNQNQLNINPENFSLQTIIEEIYDLYLHQIQEKKLNFSFQIPHNMDRILSDKKRVVQILFEIIGNAIKYTTSGSIQVKIKEQDTGLIWVKVQDSGQGMSESQKHSLFSNKLIQYYSRERDFSKKNSAGLGLDFSRKMVGVLGPFYQIFIKSSEGVGSTFKFLLYSNYEHRNTIDIPRLRSRIQKLQNQGNDQGGGIFTPDHLNHKNNKNDQKGSQLQQQQLTNNSNIQNINLSSNQVLIKKMGETSLPQQFNQALKKKNSYSNINNTSNLNQQNQIYNMSNSKIYNSQGITMFNGAVSDVAEVDELVGSRMINQMHPQINIKKDNTDNPPVNFFANDEKSNLSYMKHSQPKMEKYISLEYDNNQRYRFPLSAQYNQISNFDLDLNHSTALGGQNQKWKKKLTLKNQVFTPQIQPQKFGIPPTVMDNKQKVNQSEQRIPCIEINEDVEQRYNGEGGDFEQVYCNLKASLHQHNNNKYHREINNSEESQNKSPKIDQNNYSTKNIDDNNDSTAHNQYSHNNQNCIHNYNNKQSYPSPINNVNNTNYKNQTNNDNDNYLQQVHINSFSQNIGNAQSQKLNNSQHLSEESQMTVNGGGNVFIHQSLSIDQSGIIPKRVYNSSSTNPNNLKNLGPSIFLKTSPFNSSFHNQYFLNVPAAQGEASASHHINQNTFSHQRIEMNQVINKNNITDDVENQEPPPEQSFIDNVSPEMQQKHDSIYIESPHQKMGKNHLSFQQQPQQNNIPQIYSQNSPLKRKVYERKETRNPSVICQTLKIDDYEAMLYQAFPQKCYVLGVDDTIFNLSILEMQFKKCSNVIFHRAGNGKEAIEKVMALKQTQNAYYRVFLMDIQMPVMDGYKAHRKLKKLMRKNVIQKSPVIAVTAYADEKHICLQQGMEGFIEKPINMKELINVIYNYFHQAANH